MTQLEAISQGDKRTDASTHLPRHILEPTQVWGAGRSPLETPSLGDLCTPQSEDRCNPRTEIEAAGLEPGSRLPPDTQEELGKGLCSARLCLCLLFLALAAETGPDQR